MLDHHLWKMWLNYTLLHWQYVQSTLYRLTHNVNHSVLLYQVEKIYDSFVHMWKEEQTPWAEMLLDS